MKHGTYVKGVATGVILTVLAGGGIKAVQYCRSDEILSDLAFTQKIKYLENMIDEEYLGEISTDKLEEGVYAGLIYGLGDVYSRYYTKDEYEQESVTTEGSYVGIGVAMQKYTAGGVQIVECYKGSTAEEAGVKVDDVITAINGEDITDTELQDVVSMIKDNEDKDVVLTVQRKGEDTQEITVKVSNVELPSVFGEMLDENTGYIQITEFKGVTVEQYEEVFADLKEQGMERLVVDLRDNPGGLLNVVCDILRDILPEGLIVYTEDKMETGVRKPAMAKTLWICRWQYLSTETVPVHQKFLQVLSKTMGLERLSEPLHMEKVWCSRSDSSVMEVR